MIKKSNLPRIGSQAQFSVKHLFNPNGTCNLVQNN